MTNSLGSAAGGTNDLRGLKPPVEIPGGWEWLYWTLAALALVGFALWLWRRSRRPVAPPLAPVVPPHVRARQRLAEALLHLSDPNRFCTEVSLALRVYLEERFQLRAPERTTDEFLIELQASPVLSPAQKQGLHDFLASCDLVKFARFEPTETALRDLHDAALRLVDETQFDPAPTTATPSTPQKAGTPPPLAPTPTAPPGGSAP
jgi:hypothetical protein